MNRAFFGSRLHGELAPGKKIAVRTPDGKFTFVVGEVLEYDPPHRFSHTFKFTAHDDPPCRVTYELKEVDGGVELTLTSEDVPADTKTGKSMGRGNDMIVNNVKRLVEKGNLSFGVRCMYRIFGWLQWMTPKRCRTKNWE